MSFSEKLKAASGGSTAHLPPPTQKKPTETRRLVKTGRNKMKKYTLIDPAYLTGIEHSDYMRFLHGYDGDDYWAADNRPYSNGQEFAGDVPGLGTVRFVYIATGGDGHFHGCSVDSGTLLAIEEPFESAIDAGPFGSFRTGVSESEIREIVAEQERRIAEGRERMRLTRRRRFAAIRRLCRRVRSRAGRREIFDTWANRTPGCYRGEVAYREWHSKSSYTDHSDSDAIVEFTAGRFVMITLSSGVTIRKDGTSNYFEFSAGLENMITRRSAAVIKARRRNSEKSPTR